MKAGLDSHCLLAAHAAHLSLSSVQSALEALGKLPSESEEWLCEVALAVCARVLHAHVLDGKIY